MKRKLRNDSWFSLSKRTESVRNTTEEVINVLGDLVEVINATLFLNGVQTNPELVFEAMKTLTQLSIGEGAATSQLEDVYKNIL